MDIESNSSNSDISNESIENEDNQESIKILGRLIMKKKENFG